MIVHFVIVQEEELIALNVFLVPDTERTTALEVIVRTVLALEHNNIICMSILLLEELIILTCSL